eukprot:5882325-Prymnesium_polylepis.1
MPDVWGTSPDMWQGFEKVHLTHEPHKHHHPPTRSSHALHPDVFRTGNPNEKIRNLKRPHRRRCGTSVVGLR